MKKQLFFILMIGILLTGCSKIPANTVFSLDDLEGKIIGVQLETTGDAYASDIKDAEVKRFNKARDAVNALASGELDAVILDDGPASIFVAEHDNLRILEEPFAQEEYGLAVKKGNQELLNQINEALATIKDNGVLDKIVHGWIYDDATSSVYDGQNKDCLLYTSPSPRD